MGYVGGTFVMPLSLNIINNKSVESYFTKVYIVWYTLRKIKV